MEYSYDNKYLDQILKVSRHYSVSTFTDYALESPVTDDLGYTHVDYWQEDSPNSVPNIKNDVPYRLNSHNFRSIHFENMSNKNTNILYSGCSFTFGMGVQEEHIWPTLVSNTVQDTSTKSIKQYNLAFRGFSNYLIIKNVMAFIRTYGKPDKLFIVFPDCARDFIFDKKSGQYSYVFPRFFRGKKSIPLEVEYTKNFAYETNIMRSADMIKNLEDFCEASDIEFRWTSWYYPDFKIYSMMEFKNLVKTDTSFLQANTGYQRIYTDGIYPNMEYPYDNINGLPYWDLARDLVHPGTAWHEHIAKEMLGGTLV